MKYKIHEIKQEADKLLVVVEFPTIFTSHCEFLPITSTKEEILAHCEKLGTEHEEAAIKAQVPLPKMRAEVKDLIGFEKN